MPENNVHCFGRVAFDDVLCYCIGTADFTKHAGASARCALLRQGINFNQAKVDSPTLGPFEIIYQRPVQVATHGYAVADCSMHHCQVLQDGPWAAVVNSIAKTVLSDI